VAGTRCRIGNCSTRRPPPRPCPSGGVAVAELLSVAAAAAAVAGADSAVAGVTSVLVPVSSPRSTVAW